MITRLQVKNFKSLQSVDLKLGRVNIFIGTNASGKSNLLDVLRCLQGIANGYSVSETLDGKPAGPTNERWDGIRGGIGGAVHRSQIIASETDSWFDLAVELSAEVDGQTRNIEYDVTVSPDLQYFTGEALRESGREVFAQRGAFDFPTLYSRKEPLATACRLALSDCQRLEFDTAVLRDYSPGKGVKRIGERGEQFSSLLETVFTIGSDKDAYLSWVTKLFPSEIDDMQIVHAPKGESLLEVREGERQLTADLLSDGTLWFAALVAAFFQPQMPKTILVEEIETGLHPTRIRLLVEMLRRRSRETRTQVFATTHSPTVLDWLSAEDYSSVFVCTRDEETGASVIRALSTVPRLLELRKQRIALSELFAEGWLETAP